MNSKSVQIANKIHYVTMLSCLFMGIILLLNVKVQSEPFSPTFGIEAEDTRGKETIQRLRQEGAPIRDQEQPQEIRPTAIQPKQDGVKISDPKRHT